MTRRMRPRDAVIAARDARRILFAGCTGEPVALVDALAVEPDLWENICITGAFIPGVNDRDYSALGQNTTVETIFTTSGLGPKAKGRVAHLPLHYSAYWNRLARPDVVDLVMMTVPPPAADGTVGYGLACDFTPAAIGAGARLIGVINPKMPDVSYGPRLDVSRFEAMVEGDNPLPELAQPKVDDQSLAIARNVIGLIPANGTLQLGLGKLQKAVLESLAAAGRYDLAFHAGMISDAVLDLVEQGGFQQGVTTGVALGGNEFYARVNRRNEIRWRPVSETHAHAVLSGLDGLVSVNSVLQVDLSGQANAEHLGGRQMSGQGGMVDFVRGARASRGGRSILALPSRAGNGTSRIVTALPQGTPVSVARADVDIVVTEHGVAELREADLDTRAERLIAIAAPEFRSSLAQQWRECRS